jgi:hypothetical protein
MSAAVKAPEVITLMSSAAALPAQRRRMTISAAVRDGFDVLMGTGWYHLVGC